MRLKNFLPKILLLLGFVLLYFILSYQTSIKDFFSSAFKKGGIYYDNFVYPATAKSIRHKPITLVKKETELMLYIGEPFKSFSPDEWQEFWDLIYEAYPKEPSEEPGMPNRMRQLTTDEIASELMERYPQPFFSFTEEHWQVLFGVIAGK